MSPPPVGAVRKDYLDAAIKKKNATLTLTCVRTEKKREKGSSPNQRINDYILFHNGRGAKKKKEGGFFLSYYTQKKGTAAAAREKGERDRELTYLILGHSKGKRGVREEELSS